MNNLSLFFVGLILLVFAGLFHVYRYGMSEANKPPPPPQAAIPEEKPKALAEQPPQAETKELPGPSSDSGDAKEPPKEVPSETPQIKADSVPPNLNAETNLGTSDLKKP